MIRNTWWLAACLFALTLVGGVRSEEDCCAQKCQKACATKATETVTVAAECACEGKDKKDCKCEKCKCEPKPSSKCVCEGKDSDKCVCEKCKCMKKVEKIVTLGKEGILVLRWMVGVPAKPVAHRCEPTVNHNEGAECAEAGCCSGRCPNQMTKPVRPGLVFGRGVNSDAGVCGNVVVQGRPLPSPVMVQGPMPIPLPPFPHPVPPPFLPNPFMMPSPQFMPAPPVPVYHPVMATPPMMQCATVAVPPPAPVVAAMRFVADAGQVKMEMQHGDSCVASEKMKLKVGDDCTVQVCAVDDQVSIRCECMTAKADSVIKTGKGDRLVLEGNVTFKYQKGEQHVDTTADRVIYDATTGRFEIKTAD